MIFIASFSYAENLQWEYPTLESLQKELSNAEALQRAHDQKVSDFNNSLKKQKMSAEELKIKKRESGELAKEQQKLYKLIDNAKRALRKSADLKREYYIESNKPPFTIKNGNQGEKMSSIAPAFFMGKWKVSQSLYSNTPGNNNDIYFQDNANSTFEFFMTDEKAIASVKNKYKNFKSREDDLFYCTTLAHEYIQKQLFSVFSRAANKKLQGEIPTDLKEGSKEWKAANDELNSIISRKGKGLWKRHPHKVISFIKTENNTTTFKSCGQYLYIGRAHKNPDYDFYLDASNGLNVDVINKNKFIIYEIFDKYFAPGRYAVFERL